MTCDVSPVAMFCILIQAFVTCTYGVHTVGLVLVVSGKKIGDKLYFADFSGAKYYIADNSNNFISIPGLANALSSVTSGFLHSRLVWHLLIQNSHDDDQLEQLKNIIISMIMIFIMVQAWPTSPLLSCHFNQHCRNGPALQHDDDFMTIMMILRQLWWLLW